ncbi:MAG: undecaprenyl/decaprenyl-phosphate alpha-N-acetylglucosaminyl 1-phosphate transferase, partial [Phycisphaerales bacterium]|nr:undecaprenyl/decaprenyl-phosphate alpha-N-acetylglucosaminyl 1-phosphate transferase [Phycisphaerales bacterium]
VLTTLWIVALTNAFNFMDNMDGLSAGAAALTSLVLALCAFLAGQIFVPCLLLLIAGAVVGFLVYNFPPASIFMGDAGSLVIGYFLAVCAVLTTYYDPRQQLTPFGILVPMLVFAIPLYDMISVVIQRYRIGYSIFSSDCRHFSHRLVKLGLSKRSALLTIYLATLATALSAILLPLSNWLMAVLIFGQCLCVILIIAILEFRHAENSR